MKKFNLFSSAFVAALMLASCSAEDAIVDNGGRTESSEAQYVTVNISSVGNASTRAEDYDPTDGQNKDYVDGSDSENKINKVRFYFFDANGNAFKLNKGGANGTTEGVSWLEKTVEIDGDNHATTVETKYKAILLIDGQTGEKPAKLIAVANPEAVETKVLGDTPTESALSAALLGSTNNCNTTDGGFVMTNSVYLNNTGDAVVCATDISTKTYESQKEAEANAVDIYVERVNVKVEAFYADKEEAETKWEKASIDGKTYPAYKVATYNNQDVYAVVQGWGLADENRLSKMCKEINTSWTDTGLGFSTWTTDNYHRSFWATSVPFQTTTEPNNEVVNHAWKSFTTTLNAESSKNYLYTQENTPTAAPAADQLYYKSNTLTKVIVAAKLMVKDGESSWSDFEYATYAGETFNGGEEAVLKKAAALYGTEYYTLTTTTDESGSTTNKWNSLDMSYFEVKSHDGTKVHVGLKYTSETKLYKKGSTTAATEDDLKALDEKIQSQYTAQIAKDGATYYFAPIQHLGTSGTVGEYGVVRNHVYRIAITSLGGYGTPVVNPDSDSEVIDPEVPEDSKTYLAARMNALSWRIVKSSVDMDKTKK